MFKNVIGLTAFLWVAMPLLVYSSGCHVSQAQRETAPFNLRALSGQNFTLSDQQGKLIVMSFSTVRFPLAGQTLPALDKLAQRYEARNVKVYWVSTDSDKPGTKGYVSNDELQEFVSRHGASVSILRDSQKTAFSSLQLDALPTVIVFGREGEILQKHVGFNAESKRGYRDVIETIDRQLW